MTHVDQVCKKANSTQAVIQCNIRSCPKKIRAQCFITFVRPVLEYASAAWPAHHKSDIDKLEVVQRKAAHFVMRDYHRTNNLTNILCQPKWPTFKHCRNVSKLVMLYEIHHRMLSHLIPLNTHARGRNLRFVIPTASILVYQHVFFLSSTRMWNTSSVPLVAAPSFEAFRAQRRRSQRQPQAALEFLSQCTAPCTFSAALRFLHCTYYSLNVTILGYWSRDALYEEVEWVITISC